MLHFYSILHLELICYGHDIVKWQCNKNISQNTDMMTFIYENIGWIIKYGAFREKLYKWIVFIQYDADGVIGYK